MNTTKTLIILTPGFPANEADTTCIPFIQHFVKACKNCHPALKIVVISFQYPFTGSRYTWNGIPVNSFNGRNKGKFNRLFTWVKVWIRLKALVAENETAGVLSLWLGECALIGSLFSRRMKLKHFTWILGQDAKKDNRYQRLINPGAHSLVALSDSIAAEYRKNYGIIPAHLVPVGIDTTQFQLDTPQREIDILGAGSLIRLKRYDLFIRVIKEIAAQMPGVRSVICGNGTEKSKLIQQVKEAGLEKNLTILDELPHQEVLRLMQRSKVFLHTSEYEGYSVACAEAQYAGAHVVSYCKPMNNCGRQEYIVETQEEAYNIIWKILNDKNTTYQQRMSFSIDDVSKKMMQLFAI